MTLQRYIKLLAFFLIAGPTAISPEGAQQSPASKTGENGCRFSETYRQAGWKIPGRLGAVPKGSRMTLSVNNALIPGVFVTEMKPGRPTNDLLSVQCSTELPGRLTLRDEPVRVLQMYKLDYQEKTFGYVVQYEPQIGYKGTTTRSLAYVQVVFLDVDGSGSFTVMRNDPRGQFLASPDLPQWVKQQRVDRP